MRAFGIGVIGGIAFAAHAAFNNSHAWPLIWPLLAGVAAALFVGGGWATARHVAIGAFVSMLIAGFVTTIVLVSGSSRAPLEELVPGMNGQGLVLVAIAGTSVIGAVLAFLACGLLGGRRNVQR